MTIESSAIVIRDCAIATVGCVICYCIALCDVICSFQHFSKYNSVANTCLMGNGLGRIHKEKMGIITPYCSVQTRLFLID